MQFRRVLIIEDDASTAKLLAYVLGEAGYDVTTAESALGAIALARQLRPDVILLDLGLPYRSGASLLPEVKVDPATKHIPVIVVSALTPTLTAARAAQADALVTKPFSPQALLEIVDAVCGRVPVNGARP